MADSSPQQVTTNIMHKSTPAFSQVAFKDIPHSYSPCSPVTCSYTLTAPFQASSRDWVGIFKVGWSTTKDYHTFVWVEPCGDQQPASRQACFKDYYLPKDDVDFYQFCYVDSSGHVCGASTPFCFKTQTEPSAESTLDNDLWVITTQHQVDESVREKAALKEAADRIREKNEEMQKDLQDERRQVGILEEQKKQHSQEKSELERELSETKAQNQQLENTVQQQKQEMDSLKQEMLAQMTSQMQIQENPAGSTPGCDEEGGGGGECDDGHLGQTELQLREAQAAIAEKEVLMEEKEQLMLTIRHQNDMLTQENQNLRRDVEELRRMLKELPTAALTLSPQHEVTASPGGELIQTDAGQTRDPSYDDLPVVSITEDEDEDKPVLSCRHCLESFPGMSRAEVEEHERNHQVCPFCTLICDNMEQSVFEDHVYSHEM